MRVDKYLKVSRIIKRRTLAAQACEAGRVLINNKASKPSAEVKVDDILEVRFGSNTLKIKVISLKEVVKKNESDLMYEVL